MIAPENSPVGVIGLGLMGSVLATRLLAAGYTVHGHDIAPRPIAGVQAGTPAQIAQHCAPIVLALFDTDQVEDTVENALLPALPADRRPIVICTSTCDPDRIAALATRIAPRIRLLESPISGTSAQVRNGQGVALIGDDGSLAGEVAPILDALFSTIHLVGRCGDGGRAKLAVNLILGLNRLALAEGLAFTETLGLDPARFLQVARHSAAASQVMDTKGAKMVASDFTPEGKAAQTLKDVHLMLELARRHGQTLPLAETNRSVLQACIDAGEGGLDNSVVIAEIRRRRTPR